MTHDTTPPATELQPKSPMNLQMKVVVAAVAAMTLFIAALSFILSFDSLRALAIEIGMRPERAWMAPVAIDIAQATATACYVIFKGRSRYSRVFCATLAVVTVLISVVGNAFHAWQTAERNIARVAAGEELGFIPQAPWIGALFAAIFPLLWLALFHLFAMTVHGNQPASAATNAATDPVEAQTGRSNASPATPSRERLDSAVEESEQHPADTHLKESGFAPAAQQTRQIEATAPNAVRLARNLNSAPATADHHEAATTSNGYPQTREGLLRFLNECDFHETVKVVASLLITKPQLKQTDVAQRLQVDKSTVSRRWRQFLASAEAEGFTVPPLPHAEVIEPVRDVQLA